MIVTAGLGCCWDVTESANHVASAATVHSMGLLRARRAQQGADGAIAAVRAARGSGVCTPPEAIGRHTAAMRGRCVQALAAAAVSDDAELRVAAVTHPLCHAAWRRRLRSDPDLSVRWAAPIAAAAAMMASDHCVSVRYAAAGSEHCPPDVLRRLAFNTDSDIVRAVAENPATPAETLRRLAVIGDVELRCGVAQNRSAPRRTLLTLAEDPDYKTRACVAQNPSTPPDVLAVLAADSEYMVKMHTAANASTPPKTLMALAVDAVATESLAANPSTPRDALEGIALGRCMHDEPCGADVCQWDGTDREDVLARVLSNPSTPADLLTYLYDNPLREYATPFATIRVETDAERLAEWANHKDEYVRRELAHNPHTGPETLAVLASETGDGVRDAAVRNPSCPPGTLQDCVRDSFYAHMAASNPNCAPDTLRELALVSSLQVVVASNPSCPQDLLESIAVSGSSDQRAAVIVNAACDDGLAASLAATDPDLMVRTAYAVRTLDQLEASLTAPIIHAALFG